MATTSIWPIRGVVSTVINYARNPEKTREESAVGMHQIDNVIQYAANQRSAPARGQRGRGAAQSNQEAAPHLRRSWPGSDRQAIHRRPEKRSDPTGLHRAPQRGRGGSHSGQTSVFKRTLALTTSPLPNSAFW